MKIQMSVMELANLILKAEIAFILVNLIVVPILIVLGGLAILIFTSLLGG